MRLLYITPYYKPAWFYGGPPKCISEQAEILKGVFNYDIHVVTLNQNGNEPLFASSRVEVQSLDGVTVHYLPSKMDFISRRYFYSSILRNYLLELGKFDIVHIHTLFNHFSHEGMRYAYKQYTPYMITTHGMLDRYSLGRSRFIKKMYRYLFEDKLIRAARMVQFTNHHEYENSIVPRGAVPYFLPLLFYSRVDSSSRTDASVGSCSIVSLGRINRKKGLDVLINAISILKNDGLPVVLDIYGQDDDNYKNELEDLVRENALEESITFKGPLAPASRDEVLRQYALLAITSHQENFGLVVTEAMSVGVPVLVSNKVNLYSTVEKHNCGLVCEVNENSVAQKLKYFFSLTSEEKRQLGVNGVNAMLTEFNTDNMAREYDKMYKFCLQ